MWPMSFIAIWIVGIYILGLHAFYVKIVATNICWHLGWSEAEIPLQRDKRRHFCPSCHQKRVLEFGEWLCTEVLKYVPHRQWVFSIPKRLRIYFMMLRCFFAWLTSSRLPYNCFQKASSYLLYNCFQKASSYLLTSRAPPLHGGAECQHGPFHRRSRLCSSDRIDRPGRHRPKPAVKWNDAGGLFRGGGCLRNTGLAKNPDPEGQAATSPQRGGLGRKINHGMMTKWNIGAPKEQNLLLLING